MFDVMPQTPRKMIRALVYPNLTYRKDIEKDSFVQYLSTTIAELNTLRDDLFFTLWLPESVKSLEFPNVEQVNWPLPTHAPAMRVHFDVLLAKKLLSHANDFDLVFHHLPEATHALYATMMNLTHHRPAFFGYAHWFDLPQTASWEGASFRENLSGLLDMQLCYVNTEAQKQLVLANASALFSKKICNRLDQSSPGVSPSQIVSSIEEESDPVIVFNHRPDPYKDYPAFLRAMRELRKQRQDFTVWVPLADSCPEPWMVNTKLDKAAYYKMLRQCRVGIAPRQTYEGWSIAATDGLMNGCPYIFYDADYYQELHPGADTFTDWSEALVLINRYLDDVTYRNTQAIHGLTRARQLTTTVRAEQISADIDRLVSTLPIRESSMTAQLEHYIRANSSVTKAAMIKSLNWGRGIAWTPYRRALLRHPNIFDTTGRDTIYQWVD
jgi:glycosyltransferase involved in cell wall biosynthesis